MVNYHYKGHTVHANATPLSLPQATPAAVSGVVNGIVGLDQSTLKKPFDTLPGPPDGFRAATPCSRWFGQKTATSMPPADGKHQPWDTCGYNPQQIQKAYGVKTMLRHGFDGRGVTVAITDAYAAPTIARDLRIYNRVHHLPQFRPGQFRQIHPARNGYDLVKECGGNGWYGEETLDVEAVHSMAPRAKIVYVGAADCDGALDEAWATSIDNHVGDVLTNSWGDGVDTVATLGQSYIDFYQEFSTEAALTGITVNFSSGDAGDGTNGGQNLQDATASFPADLPYVTGVGGTSLAINRHGHRSAEYGWSTAYSPLVDGTWGAPAYSSGGGGGTSQLFAEPFYQQGVVPKSMATYYGATPMRVVPDISVTGDPNTGMIVGETQVFPDGVYWDQYRIGGTSLSSPLLAGMVAVASQQAHRPLGFANPLYYRLIYTKALHDEIAPTHGVYQVRANYNNGIDATDGRSYELQTIDVQTSTLHDVPGYDNETGVGSPSGPAFFAGIHRLMRHR
jgi:subtilase family serine protease